MQLLSQDDSLLKREELTLMLARATAQLEEKDKRILVQRGWVGWWWVYGSTVSHQSEFISASVVKD